MAAISGETEQVRSYQCEYHAYRNTDRVVTPIPGQRRACCHSRKFRNWLTLDTPGTALFFGPDFGRIGGSAVQEGRPEWRRHLYFPDKVARP